MIGSSHKVNLQGLHQAIEYTGHVDLQAIVQVVCSYAVHGESENKEVSARLRTVGEALSAPW